MTLELRSGGADILFVVMTLELRSGGADILFVVIRSGGAGAP